MGTAARFSRSSLSNRGSADFPASNERTLVLWWRFVRPGGYYIVEDVVTGARPSTGRFGCRAAMLGDSSQCGFAPGGFSELAHNRTGLGAEARAIFEQNDVMLADTLPGHRMYESFRTRMGVTWMRDEVNHNSHLLVLRKRTTPRRSEGQVHFGKFAMPHFG